MADGIGARLFYRLVDYFGGLEPAAGAGPSEWPRVEGIGNEKAKALESVTDRMIDDEIALAEKKAVEIVLRGCPGYPALLENIYDPPPVLYIRGELEKEDSLSVAVVGSRRCTHYGVEQATRFGGLLARSSFTIVSGGARGIDTSAHKAALDSGGRTVAVMGCGLSRIYPRENRKLFSRILDDGAGAIISELPMRAEIRSGNFPKRNRVISGISLGVLVVEAAVRSGAMITAGMAMEQNREVFAVPGRVDSPQSSGTHSLIRDGAHLVAGPDDIFGPLGEVGRQMRGGEDPAKPGKVTTVKMGEEEKRLYSILANEPACLDRIAEMGGMDVGRAASIMTMLVLKGVVVQEPGNVFARR